jgi:hypothetical protein
MRNAKEGELPHDLNSWFGRDFAVLSLQKMPLRCLLSFFTNSSVDFLSQSV